MCRLKTCLPWLLALAAAAPLRAQPPAVLGAAGEVYLVRTGTFGKLFPGQGAAHPADPVLALDVLRPGGAARRLLVPQTEGTAVETPASLLFEESSRTLFVVWESRQLYPVLMLAGFDGEQWSEPTVVTGDPWSVKTSPLVAVTHDTFLLPGERSLRERTVLHVVWGEEDSAGTRRTLYAPVIFEDGTFAGKPAVYALDQLDAAGAGGGEPPPTALALIPGRADHTLVAAFTSAQSRRAVGVEIGVLPAQLGHLADDARMHIVEIGRKLSYPENLQQIADQARMHIVEIGARSLQSEIALALGERVREQILARQGEDTLNALADLARMHIIEIGARLADRGLVALSAPAQLNLVEVAGAQKRGPLAMTHLISFRVSASLPAPQVGGGTVALFPAKTGRELLVAWAEPGRVSYRETEAGAWSAVREIAITPAVDLARAHEILAERMARR